MKRGKFKERFPLNYSVGKAVLDILLDLGKNATLFETPYMHMKRLWREARGVPGPKRWRYNQAIRYLEHAAQVEVLERNDKTFLKLTRKGKLRVLLERLENGYQKQTDWDGKWRLIIWDIPEKSRLHRDQIRKFIKDLGFLQLQQSVFITPYPLPQSAVLYLQESGLSKYLRFLRVDKIDDDRVLKHHFGVK